MSGVDLVQWLNAQLDTDTAHAQAAPPGPWAVNGAGGIVDANGVRVICSVGGALDGRVSRWPEGPVVEHVLAHDPAQALREIDAKRRILAEHWLNGWVCDTCDNGEVEQIFPCLTLRLLALPYSDRPGYRAEWAPTG